ncbi:hypothetical protein AKJ08_0776 [Vulgatibacter incomptus]|uniref:Uncharacterized protein n=1 Tax=Vulgatibacter incomptus TaxID=1391653 RepID=A0A0K1PB89_9BACT|nr:hypothetical protein AKJ08_0776 [Vulgatibacter incomptus]
MEKNRTLRCTRPTAGVHPGVLGASSPRRSATTRRSAVRR